MICKNCGKEISNTAKFCNYCGKATQNIPESDSQKMLQSIEKVPNKKTNVKFYAIIITISIIICILGTIIIIVIDNKSHEETENKLDSLQNSCFSFLPDITIGELLNDTHSWLKPNNEGGDTEMWKTMNDYPTFCGVNDETGITLEITFAGYYNEAGNPEILKTKIDTLDNPVLQEIKTQDFESYILDLYSSYKGTGKSVSATVSETSALTKSSSVQTTTTTTATQAVTSETTTEVTTTEAKSDSETYSITFEADELIEEAGLKLGGHVGIAVLSNLTCNNGNANIETKTIYIYDSLVKVEVTGAEAGEIVLEGTITTYGLDTNQGETFSYPDGSGVFLVTKTVGENPEDKPYVEAYVETCDFSGHDGFESRLYLDGDFAYVSVESYNEIYNSRSVNEYDYNETLDGIVVYQGSDMIVPVLYITPYSDSGVAGDVVICDVPKEISGTIQTGGMSYPVDNKKGQINCHGGTVAGFTTDYVVNGGAVGKVRNSLGDTWHVTAKNACDNYGVTWYELWDSDDGDYYGWVDENFIDFY